MQDNQLYEYAVIRVVPRVEREEFINVGIIVYCAKKRFLQAAIGVNTVRLSAFAATLDIAELNQHLLAIQNICMGMKSGGPIACLDTASRFRWLTATRSTIIQTSRVHPGFCLDPLLTLEALYAEQVL